MSGYDSRGAEEMQEREVAEKKHYQRIACNYANNNRIDDFDKLERALGWYFGKDSKELRKYHKEYGSTHYPKSKC